MLPMHLTMEIGMTNVKKLKYENLQTIYTRKYGYNIW